MSYSAPVRRGCSGRNWFHVLQFWLFQVVLLSAAGSYVLGFTQSKEYAEPEWFFDILITVWWVSYLVVFVGTLVRRKEPHIYVANWFFLAYIVAVAMLHTVNNISIPISCSHCTPTRSIPVFSRR
jgi:cytochrome c oxidase cbb3-type subunit 1